MIPKIIHYCWFGRNPLTDLAQKCIASWKRYLPEYKIMEWNEDSFDITENQYVLEAYNSKKWAFVTDYVRLKALVEYGGVYMDTDVEVIKPLESFLVHQAFSGFEDADSVPTGIMACEKGYQFFADLLRTYDNRHFILEDKSMDITTNTTYITNFCLSRGLKLNNQLQIIDGFALYPNDYFCPKDPDTNQIHITENTHTIHHFAGSWSTPWYRFKKRLQTKLGSELTNRIIRIKRKIIK